MIHRGDERAADCVHFWQFSLSLKTAAGARVERGRRADRQAKQQRGRGQRGGLNFALNFLAGAANLVWTRSDKKEMGGGS